MEHFHAKGVDLRSLLSMQVLPQLALVGLFFLVSACAAAAPASLDVFAAISLTEPLQEAARRFEAETATPVALNLAGSNTLATQILDGAPADVFLSADEAQMQRVIDGGRADAAARRAYLSNRLAVIAPAESPLTITVPADIAAPPVRRLALADPDAVPAGRYALAYLSARGVLPLVESRIVRFPHVRAASTAVEQGAADLGVVYLTDARVARGVKVVLQVDADPRWAIVYPLAPLRRGGSAASPQARAFVAFLERPAIRQLFLDAGFAEPAAR